LNDGIKNDLVTDMETTSLQEISDETDELKTSSFDFQGTQYYQFEETTEYFDFENIKTDIYYEFEELE
jgi:hypothetical protein